MYNNPATFDIEKLEWMNGEYVRAMSSDEFRSIALPQVEEDLRRALEDEELESFVEIAPLVQERTKLLTEVVPQVRFLFTDVDSYDQKSWDKVMTKDGVGSILDAAADRLETVEPWAPEPIEGALRGLLAEMEIGVGKGLQPMRVAVTGSSVSPPLFESMSALGRDRTIGRLRSARARLD